MGLQWQYALVTSNYPLHTYINEHCLLIVSVQKKLCTDDWGAGGGGAMYMVSW